MKEEVLEAASITRKLCDENLSAFGMLSNYLLKSCKKLNIEGKKVAMDKCMEMEKDMSNMKEMESNKDKQ